jgi:hypothetical protein
VKTVGSKRLALLGVVGAGVLWSALAAADPNDAKEKFLEPSDHIRGMVGGSFAYCVRDDSRVGGTGACPEILGGLQIPLPVKLFADGWLVPRLDVELGLGWMPSVSQGYPGLPGTGYSAGGTYGVGRLLLGWDWPYRLRDGSYGKTLFLTRLGFQSRLAYSSEMKTSAPGFQGVLDLGTRVVGNHIEAGFRAFFGCDGELVTGQSQQHPFAYGTGLFVRYLYP